LRHLLKNLTRLLIIKNMQFIDTHCHLSPCTAAANIVAARAAGVTKMVNIACEQPDWLPAVALATRHDELSFAVGLHPCNATLDAAVWAELCKHATNSQCVALGETGFDLHYDDSPPLAVQRECFARHAALARELDKPLVVHLRDSDAAFTEFLRSGELAKMRFVVHCFAGDWSLAEQVLAAGGYLSFTGIITFKNATPALLEVVQRAPLNRICIETDSPYLAPHPHRGKQNSPALVPLVAERIAALRDIPLAEVATATTANAELLFTI